jgi:four helix bundle protein
MKRSAKFRFEDFEMWQQASEVSVQLFDIADKLAEMRKYRFAEQLNGAAMSITNNIAEGSGSFSDKDFAHFLNIARRSVFECANIVAILNRSGIVSIEQKIDLFDRLDHISSMITNFRIQLLRINK